MYFKVSYRKNPETGKSEGYYRLIESYRNADNRVCHRTLLNVGFLDKEVDMDRLNQVRRILGKRYQDIVGGSELFDIKTDNPVVVNQLVEELWNRLVSENRIDIGQKQPKAPTVRQRHMVFEESIRHPEVREIGAEWLCRQALEQLQLTDYLSNIGFGEEETRLAITQIIARAVYPASELETARWIAENSAVCDVTRYPMDKITKDKLYKSSLKLFENKDKIEKFLSLKTNQLFDIEDKIYIYDLTNTYFEGRKVHSKIARFGRSKEQRSDCKIVVLALVINPQGFIKYSGIFEGNLQDSKSLENIVTTLRANTSTEKRATVVIDAGIATEENLKMLTGNHFDYICVSRSKLKDYKINNDDAPVIVEDKRHQKITLQKVESEKYNDFFLRIDSEAKKRKEVSMNNRFQEGFEKGLETISSSLTKKSGTKIEQKVFERTGRLKQKYPSVARFYDIDYVIETKTIINKKTQEESEQRTVKSISWKVKENMEPNENSGTYFLRTSLKMSEELLWETYNIIREIEYSFRTLKSDLDLRPVYHKKDESTMAHLHLGVLAYWIVNTVRYQLKQHDTNFQWREIVRIMNTQKAVMTVSQNRYDEVIVSIRTSDPSRKVQDIYDRLHYKLRPYSKRKFVVHRSEFEKLDIADFRKFVT